MKKKIASISFMLALSSFVIATSAWATLIGTSNLAQDTAANGYPLIESMWGDFEDDEKPFDLLSPEDFAFLTKTDWFEEESIEKKPTGGSRTSTSPIGFFTIKASDSFAVYSVDGSQYSGVWTPSNRSHKNPSGKLFTPEFCSGGGGGGGPGGGGGHGGGGGAQVPEPATIFLLGSGLLGLFGFRKKIRKTDS